MNTGWLWVAGAGGSTGARGWCAMDPRAKPEDDIWGVALTSRGGERGVSPLPIVFDGERVRVRGSIRTVRAYP